MGAVGGAPDAGDAGDGGDSGAIEDGVPGLPIRTGHEHMNFSRCSLTSFCQMLQWKIVYLSVAEAVVLAMGHHDYDDEEDFRCDAGVMLFTMLGLLS